MLFCLMRRILFFLTLLLLLPTFSDVRCGERPAPGDSCRDLYDRMQLEGIVDYTAFEQAMAGSGKIGREREEILTLIDFSKPSTEQRLYVLDLKQRKLLFRSLVAHGRNSGGNYATSFSNVAGSYKSSLGFYLTQNTYQGRNGYSLILDGLEKGINDQAKARAIVIHGAAYCDSSVIASAGRLGRSFGCPALPTAVSAAIIDTIKGGTLLYIYAGDRNYLARSPILASRRTASL